MIEIKQINTGVAEIIAVKVPEGATGYTVIGGKIIFDLRHGLNNKRFDLPPGNWTPLGLSDQLTEEQAIDIMVTEEDGANPDKPFESAKEAFASLMQANGINEPHLILKRLS